METAQLQKQLPSPAGYTFDGTPFFVREHAQLPLPVGYTEYGLPYYTASSILELMNKTSRKQRKSSKASKTPKKSLPVAGRPLAVPSRMLFQSAPGSRRESLDVSEAPVKDIASIAEKVHKMTIAVDTTEDNDGVEERQLQVAFVTSGLDFQTVAQAETQKVSVRYENAPPNTQILIVADPANIFTTSTKLLPLGSAGVQQFDVTFTPSAAALANMPAGAAVGSIKLIDFSGSPLAVMPLRAFAGTALTFRPKTHLAGGWVEPNTRKTLVLKCTNVGIRATLLKATMPEDGSPFTLLTHSVTINPRETMNLSVAAHPVTASTFQTTLTVTAQGGETHTFPVSILSGQPLLARSSIAASALARTLRHDSSPFAAVGSQRPSVIGVAPELLNRLFSESGESRSGSIEARRPSSQIGLQMLRLLHGRRRTVANRRKSSHESTAVTGEGEELNEYSVLDYGFCKRGDTVMQHVQLSNQSSAPMYASLATSNPLFAPEKQVVKVPPMEMLQVAVAFLPTAGTAGGMVTDTLEIKYGATSQILRLTAFIGQPVEFKLGPRCYFTPPRIGETSVIRAPIYNNCGTVVQCKLPLGFESSRESLSMMYRAADVSTSEIRNISVDASDHVPTFQIPPFGAVMVEFSFTPVTRAPVVVPLRIAVMSPFQGEFDAADEKTVQLIGVCVQLMNDSQHFTDGNKIASMQRWLAAEAFPANYESYFPDQEEHYTPRLPSHDFRFELEPKVLDLPLGKQDIAVTTISTRATLISKTTQSDTVKYLAPGWISVNGPYKLQGSSQQALALDVQLPIFGSEVCHGFFAVVSERDQFCAAVPVAAYRHAAIVANRTQLRFGGIVTNTELAEVVVLRNVTMDELDWELTIDGERALKPGLIDDEDIAFGAKDVEAFDDVTDETEGGEAAPADVRKTAVTTPDIAASQGPGPDGSERVFWYNTTRGRLGPQQAIAVVAHFWSKDQGTFKSQSFVHARYSTGRKETLPKVMVLLDANATASSLTDVPEIVDFGWVPLGEKPVISVPLVNSNNVDMVVSLLVEPPFSTPSDRLIIAPNSEASLDISFAPARIGSYRSLIHLFTGSTRVQMSALGVAGTIGFQLNYPSHTLDYGDCEVGVRYTAEVHITNTGTLDMSLRCLHSLQCEKISVRVIPNKDAPPNSMTGLLAAESRTRADSVDTENSEVSGFSESDDAASEPPSASLLQAALGLLGVNSALGAATANLLAQMDSIPATTQKRCFWEILKINRRLAEELVAHSDPIRDVDWKPVVAPNLSKGDDDLPMQFTRPSLDEMGELLPPLLPRSTVKLAVSILATSQIATLAHLHFVFATRQRDGSERRLVLSNAEREKSLAVLDVTVKARHFRRMRVWPTFVDFGIIAALNSVAEDAIIETRSATVSIMNQSITTQQISISGLTHEFILLGDSTFSLHPGDIQVVPIQFEPHDSGIEYHATLEIHHSFGVTPVPLRGIGAAAHLDVPDNVNFGFVKSGSRSVTTCVVANSGLMDCPYELEVDGVGFALEDKALAKGVITAASHLEIPLCFTAHVTAVGTILIHWQTVPEDGIWQAVQIPLIVELGLAKLSVETVDAETQESVTAPEGDQPLLDFNLALLGREQRMYLVLTNNGSVECTWQSGTTTDDLEMTPFKGVIPPGETLRVEVMLKPSVVGQLQAQLNIVSDGGNFNVVVTADVGVPQLMFDQALLNRDFGLVSAQHATVETMEVKNVSAQEMLCTFTITDEEMFLQEQFADAAAAHDRTRGALADPITASGVFSVTPTEVHVAPNVSHTFTITCAPNVPFRLYTARFRLVTGVGEVYDGLLRCTGAMSAIEFRTGTATSDFPVEGGQLQLGRRRCGMATEVKDLAICNQGNTSARCLVTATVRKPAASATTLPRALLGTELKVDMEPFIVTPLQFELEPQARQHLSITFMGVYPGDYACELHVAHGTDEEILTVIASAGICDLNIDMATVLFDMQPIQQIQYQFLTVRNEGNDSGDFCIEYVNSDGLPATELQRFDSSFKIENEQYTLQAGEERTVSIGFEAQDPGEHSQMFQIAWLGAPIPFTCKGATGRAAIDIELPEQKSVLDFNMCMLGTTAYQTFVLRSVGDLACDVTLRCDNPTIRLSDVVLRQNVLQPGHTLEVKVGFTPDRIVAYEGTIIVQSSACGMLVVRFVGDGGVASLVTDGQLNFGEIAANTLKSKQVIARNTGHLGVMLRVELHPPELAESISYSISFPTTTVSATQLTETTNVGMDAQAQSKAAAAAVRPDELFELEPNATMIVTVNFAPKKATRLRGSLALVAEGGTLPPKEFPFEGRSFESELFLSTHEEIDFGAVTYQRNKTMSAAISNRGRFDIEFTISVAATTLDGEPTVDALTPWSYSPHAGVLHPGQQTDIVILFDATEFDGKKIARLVLNIQNSTDTTGRALFMRCCARTGHPKLGVNVLEWNAGEVALDANVEFALIVRNEGTGTMEATIELGFQSSLQMFGLMRVMRVEKKTETNSESLADSILGSATAFEPDKREEVTSLFKFTLAESEWMPFVLLFYARQQGVFAQKITLTQDGGSTKVIPLQGTGVEYRLQTGHLPPVLNFDALLLGDAFVFPLNLLNACEYVHKVHVRVDREKAAMNDFFVYELRQVPQEGDPVDTNVSWQSELHVSLPAQSMQRRDGRLIKIRIRVRCPVRTDDGTPDLRRLEVLLANIPSLTHEFCLDTEGGHGFHHTVPIHLHVEVPHLHVSLAKTASDAVVGHRMSIEQLSLMFDFGIVPLAGVSEIFFDLRNTAAYPVRFKIANDFPQFTFEPSTEVVGPNSSLAVRAAFRSLRPYDSERESPEALVHAMHPILPPHALLLTAKTQVVTFDVDLLQPLVFGCIFVEDTAQQHITLRNTYEEDVDYEVILTEPYHVDRSLAKGRVVIGQTLVIPVTFMPKHDSVFKTQLQCWTLGKLSFLLDVSGTGVVPAVHVFPNVLDYDVVDLALPCEMQLTLTNSCVLPLDVELQDMPVGFSCTEGSQLTLPPSSATTVQIRFLPLQRNVLFSGRARVVFRGNPLGGVDLTGRGGQLSIVVSRSDFDFGMAPVGQRMRQTCYVTNDGDVPVSICVVDADGHDLAEDEPIQAACASLELQPSHFTVHPGQGVGVALLVLATDQTELDFKFAFRMTNTVTEQRWPIVVRGWGDRIRLSAAMEAVLRTESIQGLGYDQAIEIQDEDPSWKVVQPLDEVSDITVRSVLRLCEPDLTVRSVAPLTRRPPALPADVEHKKRWYAARQPLLMATRKKEEAVVAYLPADEEAQASVAQMQQTVNPANAIANPYLSNFESVTSRPAPVLSTVRSRANLTNSLVSVPSQARFNLDHVRSGASVAQETMAATVGVTVRPPSSTAAAAAAAAHSRYDDVAPSLSPRSPRSARSDGSLQSQQQQSPQLTPVPPPPSRAGPHSPSPRRRTPQPVVGSAVPDVARSSSAQRDRMQALLNQRFTL
eukprot:TRINITY_DN4359_c0_g1_i1.p1 TRINITY_DN4359_c0_g1~~TRINITY_DN4359_c0_g1_i1.p1  ORF type:complete len:3928 (-),score=933.68 TRINITY_DN4359_c0_g1_i1:200-10573(-)